MLVQEGGMAVGWPLGLGHDATGWPLGLRLRLAQEDLKWPQEPPLDDSPTYSTNSSSLDTQDKSTSLGALIGFPLHHHQHPSTAAGNDSSSGVHRRYRRNSRALRVFPASSSSGSRSTREHRHHHHRKGAITRSRSGSGRLGSHGSNRTLSKKANSLRWALLSILSCARVPTLDKAASKWSKSPSLSSKSAAGSELSTSNPRGIQRPAQCAVPFIGRSPSPVNRLYDNIMFEESMDRTESQSSKWNRLFASSSLADGDELEEVLDAVTEPLEHMKVSLMRSRSSYSNSSSDDSDWSSACDSFDRRNSPSSSSSHDLSQFSKHHSTIHLFLSRMACCRHPQTLKT
ncbi:hypothetical protein R1flu_023515 [Riccia fluitans]|uniref:Ovate family protein n=1 Tax=Riccia fluitans TaxID=41844 RepID=A0ABD1XT21_9MARC